MLFNSVQFALFFILVLSLYWSFFSKQLKARNFFILAISYIFYGMWDWRFLSLIIGSSLTDYWVGLMLNKTASATKRKMLLGMSLCLNIGLLFTFKYFGFFTDSLVALFHLIGLDVHISTFNLILPVGISFYTFQTLSYSIDIYRRKLTPEKDLIAFLAFVSFFPQLVAGPIERAKNLLPQFRNLPKVGPKMIKSGLRLMLWGLVKKVVIADQLAPTVDRIFANHEQMGSLTLVLGAVYFAIQIYCDFSGYSDIAIGVARLLGFNLLCNFNFPYFSKGIPEFWRRWHISLSTWFRDYVYLPLGGNGGTKWMHFRNILITFSVSGLWHGANWTFVVWGLLNGVYFIPKIFFGVAKPPLKIKKVLNPLAVPMVFTLTCLTWIFFRAENLTVALGYLQGILSFNIEAPSTSLLMKLPLVVFLFGAEYLVQNIRKPFKVFQKMPFPIRWAVYVAGCLVVSRFMMVDRAFIYFQF